MRCIDFNKFKPSAVWTARAKKATEDIEGLSTLEERLDYIDRNPKIWGAIREEFLKTFGPKCWFTDAPEYVARLDVEHFRPKKKAVELDGTERNGYWWLAFNLENLRLCGEIPNREHKKCYFPLRKDSPVANGSNRNWRDERPEFLDPILPGDVALVCYGEDGCVHARSDVTVTDKRRVEITDHHLGLSAYPPLVEARQQFWQKTVNLIERYKTLLRERIQGFESAAGEREQETILKQLRDMARPEAPFASVVACCIRNSGEPWAIALATLP